ncbi:phage holin [Enterococcus dongliensis]|uniref:Phage holin n=1 Tax=Enterococcus dongliensis TaxID=2559925 RepID=A0ABU3ELB7_9ENTE|nr:Flp pilus assembly pilin Flp [Enterococcus xiangfangensis]MDT2595645.1 phage holin [Enterococcus dongliensis]MDT2646855.1 phage holin [Enterococcus dongliensis]
MSPIQNKTFETLKWIALIVIPALATFVGLIGKAINWQYTDIAVIIITGLSTFLGTVLGVSNRTYKKFSTDSQED